MRKMVIAIFILSSLLYAEDNYEVADSKKEINIQQIKNELLDDIKENEKQLAKKLEPLQEHLNEISEILSEQQEKLNELETKISTNAQKISNVTNTQNDKIRYLDIKITEQSIRLDKLVHSLEARLNALNDSIGITSTKLIDSSAETRKNFGEMDDNISNRTLYITIGSIILLLFIIIVFLILKISIRKKTKSLDDNIVETRNRMEEETVKLDAKLVEILEKQIQLTELKPTFKDEEIDHSIFVKVANEIQRMRTRISNMPDDIKGIGALKNALRRLEEGLNDNEYELIDLTGKEYDDGMTTKARFIESEEIPKGQQIITKTIKLQINYKGVIIQPSEIEVSLGE